MRLSFVISFFSLIFYSLVAFSSGPSCFNLFEETKKTDFIEWTKNNSILNYAESLDYLNSKYHQILFNKSLSDFLKSEPDENTSYLEKTKINYRKFKLRRILKKLNDYNPGISSTNEIEKYQIEKIALQIENLDFLMNDEILKDMTLQDRILYRQIQHSLLSQGIEKFLFSNQTNLVKKSLSKKIFQLILLPFKDIYFRWTYAAIKLPQLNGSIIPLEVIEKVIWEGSDNNKDLLKPYVNQTNGKFFYNQFTKIYNWGIALSLAIGVGQISYTTYHDVYLQGQIKAEQMLQPTLVNSKELADKNFAELKLDSTIEKFKINFELKYGRPPNEDELAFVISSLKEKQTN